MSKKNVRIDNKIDPDMEILDIEKTRDIFVLVRKLIGINDEINETIGKIKNIFDKTKVVVLTDNIKNEMVHCTQRLGALKSTSQNITNFCPGPIINSEYINRNIILLDQITEMERLQRHITETIYELKCVYLMREKTFKRRWGKPKIVKN